MPTNLYGPNDNFDLQSSRVVPALMRKIHEAKLAGRSTVEIWGTGTPRREFMHVDDLADALVFLMQRYSQPGHINVGTGEEVTIRELAEQLAAIIGFTGSFSFDPTKPDGTPRKRLDIQRLTALGWRSTVPLDAGLRHVYAWFLEHHA
jgi:GDP-L-fucose synthase